MKVLSMQEPYATLIALGHKKIETRSWKTTYRGEILIHASVSKKFLKSITNPEVLDLIKDIDLNYGMIICEAKLIDCVEMTKDYLEQIKKDKKENLLGIYEEGRYAWLLDEIKPLETKIPIKGKLGLWEYKNNLSTKKG